MELRICFLKHLIDSCIKFFASPAYHKMVQFHHGFQNISILEQSCEKFVAFQFHFLDCMLGFWMKKIENCFFEMYEMLRCVYKRQGRGVCYAKRRKNLMCCSVIIHHHPPVLSNTITSDNAHTLLHFCAAIKWHNTLFQSVCCLFKDGMVNFDVSMF